jgi:hypothetical protein
MKLKTDDLLALLAKALSERFSEDPSLPGVHIAHLPKGHEGRAKAEWYVACQRFTGSFGQGRVNVDKQIGDDLDVVLETLARRIVLGIPKISAQRELLKALGPA